MGLVNSTCNTSTCNTYCGPCSQSANTKDGTTI